MGDSTVFWTIFGAALIGALVALVSVSVAQRLRNRRETAPLRRALTAGAHWWWRADAALRVVDVEAGRTLPGFDPQQLRGHAPWQIGADGAAPAELSAAVAATAPFFDVPIAAQLDGRRCTIALSAMPLFSEAGRLSGYAGIARELQRNELVTDGVTAAEFDRLQGDYAERTHQLELAVKELDSFSHSVSHDLRAPLRVVDGFANIVLEDYAATGKPLDDLGREHVRRIIAAAGRMNAMIDTLLGLSRMTSRDIERERVDLSRLARDLADELRAQDPVRATDFTIADGVIAEGDRTLLRLVLQNLLGNAWKFSARVPQPQVEFGVRRDTANGNHSATVYYVRDNGAGFDMRFADKMFGLFQRFHSANEFPGTGVGLATVQRIVRKHGGRIWAESQPGEGATFYFTLWESR